MQKIVLRLGFILVILCLAQRLLCQKMVIAMDINRENSELGYPYMVEAGVDHKIDFSKTDDSCMIYTCLDWKGHGCSEKQEKDARAAIYGVYPSSYIITSFSIRAFLLLKWMLHFHGFIQFC